jgi:hypothetical protein
MGIFDEEEKKMKEEIAAAERKEAQRKAERGQVARKVAEDLQNYIGTHPRPQGPDIDVGVHEDRITLRKKTTSNTLEIVCNGREAFEMTIDGRPHGPANQSIMARAVFDWLKR